MTDKKQRLVTTILTDFISRRLQSFTDKAAERRK